MLKLITESYKMYFKNFPVILLYALPLLVISIISAIISQSETLNQGMLYFYYLSFILLPVVSAATEICLYRRFFGFSIVNPFCKIKGFLIYLLTQLALGIAASAPIILFRYIIDALGANYFISFTLAVILNMFVGIYLLARFSILFPLIVQNKVPSLKQFSEYTARSYKEWLMVSVLIYTPYIIFNYTINCAILNTIIINLFGLLFVCFNIQFISAFRLPTTKVAPESRIEPSLSAPTIDTPVEEVAKVAKPAPNKTTKKVATPKAPLNKTKATAKPKAEKKPAATSKPTKKAPAKKKTTSKE